MLPASFGAPCAQSEPGIGDNELNKDKPRVGVHGSGLPTIHATLTPQGAPRLLVMFHRALLWTSQHLEPASGGRICTAQRQALTGSRIPQSSRSLLFFK